MKINGLSNTDIVPDSSSAEPTLYIPHHQSSQQLAKTTGKNRLEFNTKIHQLNIFKDHSPWGWQQSASQHRKANHCRFWYHEEEHQHSHTSNDEAWDNEGEAPVVTDKCCWNDCSQDVTN
ncbi:hypothetical protein E2C01_021068 [Portunus trituberculatus]|uniref:Uncharacterized protein n=1 Tax=Portunus trituberculatus TaxID=210409 RepID=A0A5B7E384_PORTR|nr:hypothetical protein [Portunus trituberculatus]